MGIGKLTGLAECGNGSIAGSVAALRAELAAGCWKSASEFADYYPLAIVDATTARVPIGNGYHVDLIMNYETGMMLIEYAGVANNSQPRRATRGKAA